MKHRHYDQYEQLCCVSTGIPPAILGVIEEAVNEWNQERSACQRKDTVTSYLRTLICQTHIGAIEDPVIKEITRKILDDSKTLGDVSIS